MDDKRALLLKIEKNITAELKEMEQNVLLEAMTVLNIDLNIKSLHGIIGGKNNTYVDSVKTQFLDFNDFFSKWLNGLRSKFNYDKNNYLIYNHTFDWNARASFRNVRLINNELIFEYTKKFLERNFYRNLNARVRLKPDEALWELWFGSHPSFGLLIAPEMTLSGWRIDQSEIRRAKYNYWTISHVLTEGIIDPENKEIIPFNDLESLITFYQSILKRISSSIYEKSIYDFYIGYLKNSVDPMNEPFLIPELRYAGFGKYHKYRLDFTVLNQYSEEFIGFELSPASTHLHISGLKEKQYKVNEELGLKWEREMEKRNNFFSNFGINITTFTDTHLKDLEKCFDKIKVVLQKRPQDMKNLQEQRKLIRDLVQTFT